MLQDSHGRSKTKYIGCKGSQKLQLEHAELCLLAGFISPPDDSNKGYQRHNIYRKTSPWNGYEHNPERDTEVIVVIKGIKRDVYTVNKIKINVWKIKYYIKQAIKILQTDENKLWIKNNEENTS